MGWICESFPEQSLEPITEIYIYSQSVVAHESCATYRWGMGFGGMKKPVNPSPTQIRTGLKQNSGLLTSIYCVLDIILAPRKTMLVSYNVCSGLIYSKITPQKYIICQAAKMSKQQMKQDKESDCRRIVLIIQSANFDQEVKISQKHGNSGRVNPAIILRTKLLTRGKNKDSEAGGSMMCLRLIQLHSWGGLSRENVAQRRRR